MEQEFYTSPTIDIIKVEVSTSMALSFAEGDIYDYNYQEFDPE